MDCVPKDGRMTHWKEPEHREQNPEEKRDFDKHINSSVLF